MVMQTVMMDIVHMYKLPLATICILLLLLTTTGFCQDCGRVESVTSGPEFPLSRSDIKQTWQSECSECLKWSCQAFGGGSCKASYVNLQQEASRPRWLVMQLWQPIFLSKVSAHFDAGWKEIEVFVAEILPMDLLQQHSCSADRKKFDNYNGWRKLVEPVGEFQRNVTPVSFILLNLTESLLWSRLNLHGNWSGSWFPRFTITKYISVDATVEDDSMKKDKYLVQMVLHSCAARSFDCSLKSKNGAKWSGTAVRQEHNPGITVSLFNVTFNLTLKTGDHVASLSCCPSTAAKGGSLACANAKIDIPTNRLMGVHVSTPTWVSGKLVTTTVTLTDLKFQSSDSCQIVLAGGKAEDFKKKFTTIISNENSGQGSINGNVELRFEATARKDMRRGRIECQILQINGPDREIREKYIFRIPEVSDPCVTEVDLGSMSEPKWRVGELRQILAASQACSLWNVSHTCWLEDSGGKFFEELRKISQSSFNSSHELRVRPWMAEREWLVRCRVNQSGVEYREDVKSQTVGRLEMEYDTAVALPLITIVAVASAIFLSAVLASSAATIAVLKKRQTAGRKGMTNQQPTSPAQSAPMHSTGMMMMNQRPPSDALYEYAEEESVSRTVGESQTNNQYGATNEPKTAQYGIPNINYAGSGVHNTGTYVLY